VHIFFSVHLECSISHMLSHNFEEMCLTTARKADHYILITWVSKVFEMVKHISSKLCDNMCELEHSR
jgi:hypothetical protein